MPQMAPMNWVILFVYFSVLFIMIIILNYYMFLYKPKMPKIKKSKSVINWKW